MTDIVIAKGAERPGGGRGAMRIWKLAVVAALVVVNVAGCATHNGAPAASNATHSGAPAASSTAHSAAPAASRAPLTAADIARHMGGHISKLIIYTAATDPNAMLGRQNGYTSKVAWVDQRAVTAYHRQLGISAGLPAGIASGGSIEVFSTPGQAQARLRYLRTVGQAAPMVADGYNYQAGDAVLRLSKYLTPAQARAYETAFARAAG